MFYLLFVRSSAIQLIHREVIEILIHFYFLCQSDNSSRREDVMDMLNNNFI